jgi:hypothetical protein
LRNIAGHQLDRDKALHDPARLDAPAGTQRREAIGIARVQAHGVPAFAKIGSRRATAMSRSEDRN